jgi:hypothetical protein
MVTNSLVCFFASYFPDVETKKATNGHPEILMGTDPPKKASQIPCSLQAKDLKSSLAGQKTDNNCKHL